MKIFSQHAVGILQGSEVLFSAFEDGGEMWTGSGPRKHRLPLRFSQSFKAVPSVQVGLSMWDTSTGSQRLDIRAKDITPDGFTIVFGTWADTRVARVRVDWLAIGPVLYEDDFDF